MRGMEMNVRLGSGCLVAGLLLALLLVGSCLFSGDDREPDVLSRVRDELAVGRREHAIQQREQTADLLRDLRVLKRRLEKAGETERARETEALIRDLERNHRRQNAAATKP